MVDDTQSADVRHGIARAEPVFRQLLHSWGKASFLPESGNTYYNKWWFCMLRVVPAHTCTERCIHMSYQFCLSFYIANFSFLTFNLSDHCFLVSKCLMRTQLATLFIILVCEKVLLSPHSQSSFGLQQLGSRSQCGSLSSSSLEFVELGALYLGGGGFPCQILDVFKHLFFFKCLFYLFLLMFFGFP